MDQRPLVSDETNAGAEFIRRLDALRPVKAAFWAKESEMGPWYLYIASDQISDETLDEAYGDVARVGDQMASPYLDTFLVKLISSDDPRAQAALDIHRRYPGVMATRFGGGNFGGLEVEGVYLYPTSILVHTP